MPFYAVSCWQSICYITSLCGIGDNFRVRLNGLTQWVGIKTPQNQSLYADFRIADRSGVGISIYNDKMDIRDKQVPKCLLHTILFYYYSKQYLSFGISYNYNNFKIDIDEFNPDFENQF
jgi:hypothetical protein